VETYFLQKDYEIFAISFLRFPLEPKGTLEDGMKGAIDAVSGWLKDYRYLDINGHSVLECEYASNNLGPILHYYERNFQLDKYTRVNIKYISIVAELSGQGKSFLTSLAIR